MANLTLPFIATWLVTLAGEEVLASGECAGAGFARIARAICCYTMPALPPPPPAPCARPMLRLTCTLCSLSFQAAWLFWALWEP